MEKPQYLVDENFPLFKPSRKPSINPSSNINKHKDTAIPQNIPKDTATASFSDLGLSEWAVKTCNELKMQKPRRVQQHCIPKVLEGRHVIGIDHTGSGKTVAFALPILQRLAEHPFGVFALVLTPTHELAFQLDEQFRALGSSFHLRTSVVVGGRIDTVEQAKELLARPHIVIATPGRIKVLLEDNQIARVFSRTKFLVLDEADRLLDVGFQEELKFIFQCLPENRQNLFFSATTTSNLQKLCTRYQDKLYAFQAYEGFKTVEKLTQQVIFIPKNVKDVYLLYILSKTKEMGIRSAIVFVNTCRDCHRLNLMLQVLDQDAAALYSFRSRAQRLEALYEFKSGKVPILLATDVAGRGLDIPTVDLVINYDVPRLPQDYIHRVGRTARAGRGGLALSLVTQNDIDLIGKIEGLIEKNLEKIEYKETEVLSLMKKVFSAKNVAEMKMIDDGFDEKAKERKKQKLKMLAEKGLLKETSKKRKRRKGFAEKGKKTGKSGSGGIRIYSCNDMIVSSNHSIQIF
ncbi:DEAD-box ATP-dependent RNA helicase 36-like [Trifolium pratense]|uniref:DEAD-box ATP-dependent RNA helicase 36-like n=1 Tax=Trifolium pratense TaxID=57577 RepID=UPI001E694CE1|nr:DEAD-box ATP-dependent RNA helicase 36-like [Trifolium pratense]XP_045801826.1 DEAD-box ATP-dependent RNA helicase 36-like [Trifolium pratense]